MKKFTLLPLLAFFFMACSVDNEDLQQSDNQIFTLNSEYSADELCGTTTTNYFDDFGSVQVMTEDDSLVVTISALDGASLLATKLHIVNDPSKFPTVGQGNLSPGRMDHKRSFDPAVASYSFKFSLEDYEAGNIYIATQSTFSDEGVVKETWAGNIAGNSGNWHYFEYELGPCEPSPCEGIAGGDNTLTLTVDQYLARWDGDQSRTRTLFQGYILDRGVDRTGTYDPTPEELYHVIKATDSMLGTYDTTYTLTDKDGCSDSAELSLVLISSTPPSL